MTKTFQQVREGKGKFNKVAHERKLLRKAQTINNAKDRTPMFSMDNQKFSRLAMEMEDLIDTYKENDKAGWIAFCKANRWAPSVTGQDFMA